MKRLILFIHGLGGGHETWGDFSEFIENDDAFKGLDVAFYNYRTSLVRAKSLVGYFSKLQC